MTGIAETLSAGAAAISIFDKLVEIIEAGYNDENAPDLSDVIHSLFKAAASSSRQLANATRELNLQLRDSGFRVEMNINQIESDLRWYNFIRRSRLETIKTEFDNLYRALTKFIDDITSVLVCKGDVSLLQAINVSARRQKKKLDDLVNSDFSIQKIVSTLIEVADDLNERLSGVRDNNPDPGLTLGR